MKIESAKIYDITPTILHIFGLLIAKDMDGRVLTEIFEEGTEPAKRPVTYQEDDREKQRVKERIGRLKRRKRL